MKDCYTCVYLNGAGFCSRSACTYLSENDLVPVIRCKDCKHWQYESCFVESEEGDAESIILDRFAFDFCSRAERKEE